MEPLTTTKFLLTWLCMCSASESTRKREKIAYIGAALIIFVLNLFCLVSNMIYFVQFVTTDLKGALFAFMTIYGNFAMLYTLTNAFQLQHKINALFETLFVICCESKYCLFQWNLNFSTILFIIHRFQMMIPCRPKSWHQQMTIVNFYGSSLYAI